MAPKKQFMPRGLSVQKTRQRNRKQTTQKSQFVVLLIVLSRFIIRFIRRANQQYRQHYFLTNRVLYRGRVIVGARYRPLKRRVVVVRTG